MSIDAQVAAVVRYADGSGYLKLRDRPARPGGVPGIAGQSHLRFHDSPPAVVDLIECEVWGSAEQVMLGDTVVAWRDGYTLLVFRTEDVVRGAIEASREAALARAGEE